MLSLHSLLRPSSRPRFCVVVFFPLLKTEWVSAKEDRALLQNSKGLLSNSPVSACQWHQIASPSSIKHRWISWIIWRKQWSSLHSSLNLWQSLSCSWLPSIPAAFWVTAWMGQRSTHKSVFIYSKIQEPTTHQPSFLVRGGAQYSWYFGVEEICWQVLLDP